MVNVADTVLLALDAMALIVAGAITVISFRVFRETKNRTYRLAFIGFLHLFLGVASEAVLFRVGSFPISLVHTIETLFFVIGFTMLYLSLK